MSLEPRLLNTLSVGVLLDFTFCVWARLKAGKVHLVIPFYSYNLHILKACKAIDRIHSD